MKNIEIIKQSLLFPIKYYKHFIIVTVLFLISELSREHFLHLIPEDHIIPLFIISILLPLIVLGISLQIIFHAIDDKKGFPKLTLKSSIDEAAKDTVLELYYYGLALIITVLLSIPIGLFRNMGDFSSYLSNIMTRLEHLNPIEIIGAAHNIFLLNNIDPLIFSLIIFIIAFIIMFSLCTLCKIDLETNHNFKQIFNIKYVLSKVMKIGIKKYLEFLLLVIIICILVANIVQLIHSSYIGSFLSALLESFSLFFFLHSFAQLYPD
ncbi:MAG: DUF4013 domain-containing protein [Methanosphaera stadtmanae]|jgi:hypothetical protein|nr:DUF4013 domain-containing protein [Methanosphaera stadtmanae]